MEQLKCQLETNNWDIETCRNKLEIIFCFQNCSDLLGEKIVLMNLWNLQIFWDHWDNLFEQWMLRTIFVTECFLLVPGDFPDLINTTIEQL